jgi:DNA polymerase I-like protein with 3'-5' exonuclease and polymerase domains
MRILAYFSQDEILQEFFATGQDIHQQIASHWLSKSVQFIQNVCWSLLN